MVEVFNKKNTQWKEGGYSLLCGQAPALYDSINTTHPKMFALYKAQKAADWSEDEINLEQSRLDMLSCPTEIKDIMVKNIALQWELDSIAARSIAPVLGAFITNSEYWAAVLKVAEIEVLHALTYSEIVRQCISDPQEIFQEVMNNEEMFSRIGGVGAVFGRGKSVGAKYTLGLVGDDEAYDAAMLVIAALYCLERIQFMASFAATFAVVEQGWFQGIGKLVQKIMQDERFIHAEVGKLAIEIELSTPRGKAWFSNNKDTVHGLIDKVVLAEHTWCKYLFSDGRKVVGLNEGTLTDWVDFNSQDVYKVFGFPCKVVKKSPIKFMDNWLDLNKNQNAQQESDSANYSLNIIYDDLGDTVIPYP